MTRPQRMIEGRLTAAQVMAARRDAMAATTPGTEPRARRTFAAATLTVCLAVGLLCLWYGTLVAQDIGSSLLTGDTDPAFFAGLLDELAQWWDSLGPMGQLLVTALGVMLLMTTGASFALAMGAVGVMTWAMAHGHGLASYLNNPAAAKASYLRNLTLGQALTDGLDLAMTFIPLGAAGAGSVARTTARTMATNRTLMKEGAKEATQATEHTAARTQAQHVAESQAAHTRAARVKEQLPATKRNKRKAVSSDRNNDALSGWSKDRPPGFLDPNVEEVLQVTDEMGYPRTSHYVDQGVSGKYFASHAERQMALNAEWPHIGVSKPMCPDCQGWFRSLAQYQHRDWYVTDPDGTWIFRTDGSVVTSSGLQVPTGQPIPEIY